jgi:hypothetical protein
MNCRANLRASGGQMICCHVLWRLNSLVFQCIRETILFWSAAGKHWHSMAGVIIPVAKREG